MTPIAATASRPVATDVAGARRATVLAFVVLGLANATWASRVPQVRARLGLDEPTLGLLLLCIAAGAVGVVPGAGPLVARIGSRRALRTAAVVLAAGMLCAAAGVQERSAGLLAAGLFVFGGATGLWDVAINVQGTAVQHAIGRPILSRFHATFSGGSVAGALLGVTAILLGISPSADVAAVGVLTAATTWRASRAFVPDVASERPARRRGIDLRPWREPRTILLGVMVFGFALAEGSGNDWIGVSVVAHDHAAPALGTVALGCFLGSMTLGRWYGGQLLTRFGRVRTLRALAALAIAGVLVFVLADGIVVSILGTLLWGLGTSLGLPVGYSAGADDQARAATRVGTIASVGYLAFLSGPPIIGFVAGAVGLPDALGVTGVALLLSSLFIAAARPLASRGVQSGDS